MFNSWHNDYKWIWGYQWSFYINKIKPNNTVIQEVPKIEPNNLLCKPYLQSIYIYYTSMIIQHHCYWKNTKKMYYEVVEEKAWEIVLMNHH